MPQPKIFSATGNFPASFAEQHIDLNDQLVKNKAATFLMRVHSNAMQEAGIQSGDVIVVDCMLKPQNGNVVIAALQGELIIRRYECTGGKVQLVPSSGQLSPITVDPFSGWEVWGVVTFVIRSM